MPAKSARSDPELVRAHADEVTGMKLPAASELGIAIDRHPTAGDKGLGLASVGDGAGKLQ